MTYISVKEAAKKWGISERRIQMLCKDGYIKNCTHFGKSWQIPSDADNPSIKNCDSIYKDKKGKVSAENKNSMENEPAKNEPVEKKSVESEPVESEPVEKKTISSTYIYPSPPPLPLDFSAFSDLNFSLTEEETSLSSLFQSDMSYLRGDFEGPKKYYYSLFDTDHRKIAAATIAIICAVSSGDYGLYHDILTFSKRAQDRVSTPKEKKICMIPSLCASLSMYAAQELPKWLIEGDFKEFSPEFRPIFAHLYLMYLVANNMNIEAYAVAKQVGSTNAREHSFNYLDIYFLLYQAHGALSLGREAEAVSCVDRALDMAIPAQIYTPFSELLILLQGVLDNRLYTKYPKEHKIILTLWKETSKNWISFHNRYAKDHITTILTIQESYVASLLVKDYTYEQCCEKMHLSMGRIKNIISSIYSKLYIKNKKDLKKYVR